MIRDLVSLIFPETCSGCGRTLYNGEELLCLKCRSDLPITHNHLSPDPELSNKLKGRVKIDGIISYLRFRKSGIVQSILHQIKYKNAWELARRLGLWYGATLKQDGFDTTQYDLIIPVPLHSSKLKKRGYNQSEYFAEGLSKSLEIPCVSDILYRSKKGTSQTHKSRDDRWESVSESFAIRKATAIDGKSVLLVDDVITTGATLEACISSLQKAGAVNIGVAVLAEAL